MPAPVQDVFVSQETSLIQLGLEPAYNAFHSFALLAKAEKISGLSEWISNTSMAMTSEEKENHRLVMHGLYYAAMPSQSWLSFEDYLGHLETVIPETLQDKLLDAYSVCTKKSSGQQTVTYDKSDVLSNFDSYLDFLGQCFDAEHIDAEFEARAYAYLSDPIRLKEVIISHLSHMWGKYLRDEWVRIRPMLNEAVEAFRQVDYSILSRAESFEYITTRKIPSESWAEIFDQVDRITFIPSAHIGPYLGQIETQEGIGVIFGARMPEGAHDVASDLSRAEILVRLSALADDTRLQMLRAIGEKGEMRSQDIMNALNLSQSATSRHLSQLNATGYLIARRCEGAKCYRLNVERIEATINAVSTYLTLD